VEDRFGVKITEIVEKEERVKKDPLILSRYVVRYRGGSDRFWLYHRL